MISKSCKMKKALILNTVRDARDCLLRGFSSEYMFFSTHPSVTVYLKEKSGINCRCVSEFLSLEQLFEYKDQVSKATDKLLNELDHALAPVLNDALKVNMRYFVPMYSYFGKLHFSAIFYFVKTLEQAIEKERITSLDYYGYSFNNYYGLCPELKDVIGYFFPDIPSSQVKYSFGNKLQEFALNIKEFLGKARSVLAFERFFRFVSRAWRKQLLQNDRKNILVNNLSYELSFLSNGLPIGNLVLPSQLLPQKRLNIEELRLKAIQVFSEFGVVRNRDKFSNFFLKEIKKDFLQNLADFVRAVSAADSFHNEYVFSSGVWDLPPVWGINALQFEYLNSRNVPVLGAQHGASYGDCFEPWHFDSDFNRCDYFLSYGFDANDLERLYPGTDFRAEIIPAGKIKEIKIIASAKKIDIVFPLSGVTSIFIGGLIIAPPHEIVRRQTILLEYLNSLKNMAIVIKLAPGSGFDNCAVKHVLKRLKNLRVVEDMPFSEFLKRNSVDIAIMETSSTPLYEAMDLDIEIFLMNDPMHPFERMALEDLKKRVYYSENTHELVSMLDMYVKGGLAKKRDRDFLRHYVYRPYSKEKTISAISNICHGKKTGVLV